MPKLFQQVAATDADGGSNLDKTENQFGVKFWAMHVERIESLKKLINIPAPDECNFLWTSKSFNAFTFVPFCIHNFGHIQELYLSTYTINKRIIEAIIRQLDAGNIDKICILVAESLKFRMPAVVDQLNSLVSTRKNIEVIYGWNHSKVTCVRCDENYFVLEGSGNWSENAAFEQYVLINSKKIYEFRKENLTAVE